MRILFLDESGTPEDACFAVGGVSQMREGWYGTLACRVCRGSLIHTSRS